MIWIASRIHSNPNATSVYSSIHLATNELKSFEKVLLSECAFILVHSKVHRTTNLHAELHRQVHG